MNNDSKNSKEQLLAELAELRKESKSQAEMLKAANQQLRAANQQLEASNTEASNNLLYTLENMSDGFVSLDKNWKYTYVNKKAGVMLGRKPEDLVGKHIWTEFPEGIGQPFYKNYYKAVETQDTISFEDYYKPWNRWYENRLIPSEKGLSIFFHDITERKQAEDKVIESEKRFRNMFNNHSSIMLIIDPDNGNITDTNSAAEAFYGYSHQQLCNLKIQDINQLSNVEVEKEMQNAKNEQRNFFIFPHKLKNGEIRIVEVRSSPIEINNKKMLFSIIQDITERKMTEEALQESESKFRNLSESTLMGIGLYRNDYWIYANHAAEEISGYSFDELKKMKFWEFIAPEYVDLIKDRGRARQNGNQAPSGYEFKIITKQGKEKWVFLTGNSTEFQNGKAGLITVFDITERKRTEEELRESEKKLNIAQLLANIGDFSWNVITGEVTWSDGMYNLLKYDKYEDLDLAKVNANIHHPDDLDRITKWLNDCLESGKDKLEPNEYRIIRKDGKVIYVHTEGYISYKNGKAVSVFGMSQDITERKQAEDKIKAVNQQLRASNQQLQSTEQQLRASNQELIASQEALKESELKFQKIIYESFAGIAVINEEGKVIVWNNALEEITGIKNTETIDRYIWDVQAELIDFDKELEKRKKEVKSKLLDVLKTGNAIWLNKIVERNYLHPDGSVKIVSGSMYTIKTQKGFIVVSVSNDVTESKKAEQKLKESEELFSKAFRSSPIAITITNQKTGKYVQVNKAWSSIYGYTEEETIGKSAEDLKIIDKKTRLQIIDELKLKGSLQNVEMQLLNKSGSYKWILFSTESIVLGGEPCILSTGIDITERKQAELNMLESEKNFSDLVDNLMDGVAIADENAYHIYVNPRFSEITGYSKDELYNMTGWDFTRPQDIPELKKRMKDRLAGKPTQKLYERVIVRKDGKEVIVEMSTTTTIWRGKKCPMAIIHDITERKKVDKALKEAQSNLQALLDNRVDSIWSLDRNYNFIVFNKPYADVIYSNMGIRLKKGMNAFDIHPKEVNDFWKPKFDKVFKGEYVTFEFSHILDGQEHFFEVLMNPIYTDNIITGLSALSMDITKRKQAELELSKLSAAVTQSPSIITITDVEGKLEYVNPKFLEITGYSKEEVIGQNSRILKSGDLPDEEYKELWETISSGNVWRGEFHNKKKNGDFVWEMALVSPIFDEQGKIINYIKVAEDITKEKRNEQIESIIHNISNAAITSYNLEDFITLVKKDLGKIIDTTNFYIALYDEKTDSISLPFYRDEKEIIKSFPAGKTLTNYVIKTGKTLLATKEDISKLEKSGKVESIGHPTEVWLGVPLKSKKKVIGIFAVQSYNNENDFDKADAKMLEIISDQISMSIERLKAEEDIKIAKEKAEESNRLKTAFINNMSHEIRTPLNGITGFISLLQNPKVDEEEKQEFYDIINKSSKRLISTVTDIMDISRIEAGEVKVSKSEVSINEILDEQYKFFLPETNTKGIDLSFKPSLKDREAHLVTDKHKLEGILTNLIKNAIKFTESGSVTFGYEIKSKEENNMVEFYVKDTGIGIPANRVDAIFNRFEQADIEDRRAFQGSGLGLAISKSYVEMLGGYISVKSKEGEGSIFTFSIPFIQHLEEEGHTKEDINMESKTALSQLSLIVAEDDETSKLFYNAIFKNKFKKIIYTSSGKLTIEKLRENPDTDIILMDIQMPNMNGYDATREIRKFNTDVVIIAQTAFGLSGDREKALEAGCDDYISKPVNKDVLFEKIRACLDK